jgi:hypothetical protein
MSLHCEKRLFLRSAQTRNRAKGRSNIDFPGRCCASRRDFDSLETECQTSTSLRVIEKTTNYAGRAGFSSKQIGDYVSFDRKTHLDQVILIADNDRYVTLRGVAKSTRSRLRQGNDPAPDGLLAVLRSECTSNWAPEVIHLVSESGPDDDYSKTTHD